MKHFLLTILSVALVATNASAATLTVSSLANAPGNGVWGTFLGSTPGGTASIKDLAGVGGNLESGQPLGSSAVQLTTGPNNLQRAQVGILGDFGDARTFLNNLDVGYSYYKDGTVASTNPFAAPSLKLVVFSNDNAASPDSYGELIYEPNWNQPAGGSSIPPANSWQTVSIDSNTGSGATGTGGWWWSGGFGQSSGAGGPPIRSASEWAALFNADFDTARIVGVSVGVGTYNLNQVGYFDAVRIGSTTYDFQNVPEPTSLAIFSVLGLVAAGLRRRQNRSK